VTPGCGRGKLLGPWNDSDGTERYACLYLPSVVTPDRKLPLVVYVHPSLFAAGWITVTNLLDLQNSVSLSQDPQADGYIVLAPEGRKTNHHYPFPDNHGIGWDNWYRQLDTKGAVKIGDTSYSENVDAATIDHFIQEQVATGKVDTSRIYVTGWSNGAAMAYLYALNRPNVAAVAVYSAPNPFGAFDDPCPQTPQATVSDLAANNKQIRILNPGIPTMHIHNACDVGGICPNGELLATQLRAAGVSVEDIILDNSRHRVEACMDYCGTNPNGGLNPLSNPWGSSVG
jgi:poly(3-hydroxybutyrate) depolymerase